MNLENPTNSLSEERQRLEREQDELFAQLQSDPNNVDAKEELERTLEQIKTLGGPKNTNINKLLETLNEKADKQLSSIDNETEVKLLPIDIEEDFIEITKIKSQIEALLPKLPEAIFMDFLRTKNILSTTLDDLSSKDPIDARELSSLFGRYNKLLDDINNEIKKS